MPIRQYANLFGNHLPVYGICVGAGLLTIGMWMLYSFKRFKMNGTQQNEILFGFPFMILTGLLISFLLDAIFTGDWITWNNPIERKFGFTFTGWLLGALMFIVWYGHRISFGSLFLLNMFLPSFALAQSVGRLGCFLGGCCYGIPYAWGIGYPEGSLPYSCVGGIPLLPIQLIDSLTLLLLFFVCIANKFSLRAIIYLCGVSLTRFVTEFFRYDHRGSFFGLTVLSSQQYMSLLFMVFAVFLLLTRCSRDINRHCGHGTVNS